MIVTTTEAIEGKKIIKSLGLARGNTIRARRSTTAEVWTYHSI